MERLLHHSRLDMTLRAFKRFPIMISQTYHSNVSATSSSWEQDTFTDTSSCRGHDKYSISERGNKEVTIKRPPNQNYQAAQICHWRPVAPRIVHMRKKLFTVSAISEHNPTCLFETVSYGYRPWFLAHRIFMTGLSLPKGTMTPFETS